MNYEQKIAGLINITKCNFLNNISVNSQSSIIDIVSKKLILDKDKNNFPIIIDSGEIIRTSIKIEQALLKLPNGVTKIDITPTDELKRCLDMRFNCQLNELRKEELIDLKNQIFSVERSIEDSNFNSVKKLLVENYLLHYLLTKVLESNSNLKMSNVDNIFSYYEMFTPQNIDIEKLLLEIYPCMYDLDGLYDNLRDVKGNNKYIYFLRNGQYIIDFLVQEIINYFMFNQRNNSFLFNYLSSDDCCHLKCGDFHLENGHDVNFINGYQKIIN